jgi:signal transduction histidine kinase
VTSPGETIAAAERAEIFEPYGQLGTHTVGYGLGLALARAIVEMHEGKIWVEDNSRGGAVFVFELRFNRKPADKGRKRAPAAAADHAPRGQD